MLKLLLVDDEAPAHDVLAHLCKAHHDVTIVSHCYSAGEALAALQSCEVDLMLLDIRMPGFGGLDLLRGLQAPPITIVISAHREHALDGYDLDVVDYLLKPEGAERFDAALDKARRRLSPIDNTQTSSNQSILLKVDRALRRFHLAEVSHFEGNGNFVRVWLATGQSVLATVTLRHLVDELPRTFVQVHKSFIVNRDRVLERHADRLIMQAGATVPVGRSFRGSGINFF